MQTKTVFQTSDLIDVIDAVFEYNGRGQVQGLAFFDAQGNKLEVASIEAIAEEKGLAVRTSKEPTLEEQAAASILRNPLAHLSAG